MVSSQALIYLTTHLRTSALIFLLMVCYSFLRYSIQIYPLYYLFMTTFLTTSPLSLQDASIQSDPKSSTSTLQAIYSKIVNQMEMKFIYRSMKMKMKIIIDMIMKMITKIRVIIMMGVIMIILWMI